MVCRFCFDIEVIRIIVFVTHSLVIKTIRYDQPPSLESELEIRSAPHRPSRTHSPLNHGISKRDALGEIKKTKQRSEDNNAI